jgi:hypothetical protein
VPQQLYRRKNSAVQVWGMSKFSGRRVSDALYQGTTLVVPHTPNKDLGFSPWVFSLPGKGSRALDNCGETLRAKDTASQGVGRG